MKLITKEIQKKLTKQNFTRYDGYQIKERKKQKPYLKLFNPCGSATWLLSEYDPETRLFFGLCDLGFGCPELGYVGLDEILEVKLPFGLKIERDKWWKPEFDLDKYYAMSKDVGRITYG